MEYNFFFYIRAVWKLCTKMNLKAERTKNDEKNIHF